MIFLKNRSILARAKTKLKELAVFIKPLKELWWLIETIIIPLIKGLKKLHPIWVYHF